MSSLKTLEKEPFEDLLRMSTGYVLHFTNATFASLFEESVGKDIYDDRYLKHGDSKAKRLRAFWETEDDEVVGKVLGELLDIWEYKNPEPNAGQKATLLRCRDTVGRLLGNKAAQPETEDQFLRRDLRGVSIHKVRIERTLLPILESRFQEATRALAANAPLAAIFMCGSVLEGLLLGTALAHPREFNQARGSPKDDTGKVKPFQEWKLSQFIDVSCELGYLRLDVKKFSHALRDFRNYIHPYQQMTTQFTPDAHTAEICMQVLRAAVASLSKT